MRGIFGYEGEEALGVLREMGQVLRLYVNYFQPSVKLLEKVRLGIDFHMRQRIPLQVDFIMMHQATFLTPSQGFPRAEQVL